MTVPPGDPGTAPPRCPSGREEALRLWLRRRATAGPIEAGIRRRLRAEPGTTLPRRDLRARLHRAGGALTRGEIPRRMRASNGTITGLAARREAAGLVERRVGDADRRARWLRPTPKAGAPPPARRPRARPGSQPSSPASRRRSAPPCSAS